MAADKPTNRQLEDRTIMGPHLATSSDLVIPCAPASRAPRELPLDLVRQLHEDWEARGDASTVRWLGSISFLTPRRFGTGTVESVDFIHRALAGRKPMILNAPRHFAMNYYEIELTPHSRDMVIRLARAVAVAMELEEEWLHYADIEPFGTVGAGPSLQVIEGSVFS